MRGIDHGKSTLDESEVTYIYMSPMSLRKLANMFNISHGTVQAIRNKRTWSHVTDRLDNATTTESE